MTNVQYIIMETTIKASSHWTFFAIIVTTVGKIGIFHDINRGAPGCDRPTPIFVEDQIIVLVWVRTPDLFFFHDNVIGAVRTGL